ncbi:MAG: hypothetical protein ACOX9C_09860 [Kiritimatiellia bacterium]|jgi:hypothetical protein
MKKCVALLLSVLALSAAAEEFSDISEEEISRKPDARCKGHLKRTALGAMRSIQKQPRRARSYFKHESIIYAS